MLEKINGVVLLVAKNIHSKPFQKKIKKIGCVQKKDTPQKKQKKIKIDFLKPTFFVLQDLVENECFIYPRGECVYERRARLYHTLFE